MLDPESAGTWQYCPEFLWEAFLSDQLAPYLVWHAMQLEPAAPFFRSIPTAMADGP